MIATKKENGVKHEADVQLDTISVRDAVLSPPFDKHRPEQIYKLSLHQVTTIRYCSSFSDEGKEIEMGVGERRLWLAATNAHARQASCVHCGCVF